MAGTAFPRTGGLGSVAWPRALPGVLGSLYLPPGRIGAAGTLRPGLS